MYRDYEGTGTIKRGICHLGAKVLFCARARGTRPILFFGIPTQYLLYSVSCSVPMCICLNSIARGVSARAVSSRANGCDGAS